MKTTTPSPVRRVSCLPPAEAPSLLREIGHRLNSQRRLVASLVVLDAEQIDSVIAFVERLWTGRLATLLEGGL